MGVMSTPAGLDRASAVFTEQIRIHCQRAVGFTSVNSAARLARLRRPHRAQERKEVLFRRVIESGLRSKGAVAGNIIPTTIGYGNPPTIPGTAAPALEPGRRVVHEAQMRDCALRHPNQ